MVTHDWIKQVFAGDKRWLKNKEVCHCNAPRYDEVSVHNLYDECMQLPQMALYFPDRYPKGRHCNRQYFFNVLATIQPEYCAALIRESKDHRFKVLEEDQEKEAITITADWASELKQFPQFARSKGRMIHLLKQKSKIGMASQGRKKFKAMMPNQFASQAVEKEKMQMVFGKEQNQSSLIDNRQSSQPATPKKIQPTVLEIYKTPADDQSH